MSRQTFILQCEISRNLMKNFTRKNKCSGAMKKGSAAKTADPFSRENGRGEVT
jgi:hypothetical protein